MKKNLRTWLIVGLLAVVVFAATVIATLSPKQDPVKPGAVSETVGDLTLGFADYQYRPDADEYNWHYLYFNGFFEQGTDGNWVPFVMRNFRESTSYLRALRPSCPKCTSARAGSIPADALNQYLLAAAAGNSFALPGAFNPLGALHWAAAVQKVDWFPFDFEDPKRVYAVPGAKGNEPSWVIVELDFRATGVHDVQQVAAYFDLLDEKKERLRPMPITLRVSYASRPPFEIWPGSISVKDMQEGCEPQQYDVYIYSATREFDRLPAPDAAVEKQYAGLTVSKGLPLTAEECRKFSLKLTGDPKASFIRSAYRYTVTVYREAPGEVAEVSEFNRTIAFAKPEVSGTLTVPLPVKGRVTGSIRLKNADVLEMLKYETAFETKKEFRFIGDKPDEEIELLLDQCEPKFVKAAITKASVEFGKKIWNLTLTIPANEGQPGPWTGSLVFRTKGPKPVTYRVPITGRGQ